MTKKEGAYKRTKEHLVPTSITGSRPYDFMVCDPYNKKKGALDELIAWMVRFGTINTEQLGHFDLSRMSDECRKSVVAIFRHIDLDNKFTLIQGGGDWAWAVPVDWKIIEGLHEWTRWFARGIYFLETGVVLKHKEGMRYPNRMILTEFLDAKNMIDLKRKGLDAGAEAKVFRPAPNALRWGDVWLEWQSIKKDPACLCVGGKYVFAATVVPYSEKVLLESINRQLRRHPDPMVRSGVTDVRKVRGKALLDSLDGM